jgi:uncharacterized protein YjiS (DUF1127 family)
MESTWSRPIPLSRAVWLRIGDGVLDAAHACVSTMRRLWVGWQASRRRAVELRALRQLSPTVLRDIGVEPQWINEAQRWHDQHNAARSNFLRGL